MAQSVREIVKRLFYFRALGDDLLDGIAAISSVRAYLSGELIFSQGEDAVAFFSLRKGKVQIYKISREGKEMILHLFGPGEMFAETPAFSGIARYPANSLCMENTEVVAIESASFRLLVKDNPDLAFSLLSVFAQKLHKFSEIIEDLSLRTVDSRLAKYLLSVSENTSGDAVIHIQKKTLASILGTIPETLSRTFKKLSEKGMIQVDDNRIRLLEPQQLAQVAGMDQA